MWHLHIKEVWNTQEVPSFPAPKKLHDLDQVTQFAFVAFPYPPSLTRLDNQLLKSLLSVPSNLWLHLVRTNEHYFFHYYEANTRKEIFQANFIGRFIEFVTSVSLHVLWVQGKLINISFKRCEIKNPNKILTVHVLVQSPIQTSNLSTNHSLKTEAQMKCQPPNNWW